MECGGGGLCVIVINRLWHVDVLSVSNRMAAREPEQAVAVAMALQPKMGLHSAEMAGVFLWGIRWCYCMVVNPQTTVGGARLAHVIISIFLGLSRGSAGRNYFNRIILVFYHRLGQVISHNARQLCWNPKSHHRSKYIQSPLYTFPGSRLPLMMLAPM